MRTTGRSNPTRWQRSRERARGSVTHVQIRRTKGGYFAVAYDARGARAASPLDRQIWDSSDEARDEAQRVHRDATVSAGPTVSFGNSDDDVDLETSAWDLRDEVLDGMSRALWVSSYADFADNLREEGVSRAELEDRGIETAGAGEDWDDVAPETPIDAEKAAHALASAYAQKNQVEDVTDLLALAVQADDVGPDELDDDYADSFGHNLAMMAMGTGVSWFDDHKQFDLKQPDIETYFDGEDFDFSLARANKALTAATRAALPARSFAVPPSKDDPDGGLPIDTAGRTRSAMARFDQYSWKSRAQKKSAFGRIMRRAKALDIDPSGFEARWKGTLR